MRISSSSTMVAPSVIRIWNRCWPYTGRTITRSSAMPSAHDTTTAPATASRSSPAFSSTDPDEAQPQYPLTRTATLKPA